MTYKQRAIERLEEAERNLPPSSVVAASFRKCIELLKEIPEEDGWIPVEEEERVPEAGKCILLAFENASFVDIGRYEEDELGGAFYPGDDDRTYVSYGLFVKAWRYLPEPPREA